MPTFDDLVPPESRVPQPATLRTWPTPTLDGVLYVPWTNGYAVGFACRHRDGRVEYIYLNPSHATDDGQPNVFLYRGPHGDPSQDSPSGDFDVFEPGCPGCLRDRTPCADDQHRPDDMPEPGDRCEDCEHALTWRGPGLYDWDLSCRR